MIIAGDWLPADAFDCVGLADADAADDEVGAAVPEVVAGAVAAADDEDDFFMPLDRVDRTAAITMRATRQPMLISIPFRTRWPLPDCGRGGGYPPGRSRPVGAYWPGCSCHCLGE
ncbi:MAG TPA: hypothetical protein VMV92_39435 [Streptosporangiaceae bacterium]|nr:hypothetical protein [Streptosporangiaceae bacterium]